MKFCSYTFGGTESYGLVEENEVIDLRALLGASAPRTLEELIEDISSGRQSFNGLAGLAKNAGTRHAIDKVTLRPPVSKPGKIIGVAINNRIGQLSAFRPFENPAFFYKPRTSLIGHGAPVIVEEGFGLTHPEPELAVVIGRGGRNIAEADALDHVFGYTIINDVTSPGLKEGDSLEIVTPPSATGGYSNLMRWRRVRDAEDARSIYLTYHARSKGTDSFGPLGPWIVSRDEIRDPNRLAINSYDGDDLVFVDSTANLTFSVERVISHASRYMTLEPGDIIHCGTAMKAAENGKFRTLTDWDLYKSGRPMTIEIEGIGRLVNPVSKS